MHVTLSVLQWELVHDCVMAKAGDSVSVIYRTKSINCSVTYRVEGKGFKTSGCRLLQFSRDLPCLRAYSRILALLAATAMLKRHILSPMEVEAKS